MALPIYFTGTVSVAAGGTVVTMTGGMWSGINAKQGDFISIDNSDGILITEVTDATHLKIPPWQGAAKSNVTYTIYQNYVGRVVGVAAAEDVGDMLEKLHVDGLPFIVGADEEVPDPSYGDEGQLAFKPSTGEWWEKSGGAWVPSAGLVAAGYGGTSTSSVTIGTGIKTFQLEPDLAYAGGRVRASVDGDPTKYVEGLSDYDKVTGIMTITSDVTGGSGTFADWEFSVVGSIGPAGPQGIQGPVGPQGPPGASGSGSGNVTGPTPPVVNDRIVVFDGTSGTAIKDGGKTIAEILAGGGGGFANPTASIGLTAVNGSATTATRSDAAPALSQAIVPTWTGKHIFSGPAAATENAVFVENTSYTTNVARFGKPLAVVNAGKAGNGLVVSSYNDQPANTSQFPVAITGSAVIQNDGNSSWGGYFECHQFGTGVGNGVEIDNFNYKGPPDSTLPPARGVGGPTTPIGLSVVAAGIAGMGGTLYDGSVGIHVGLQPAGPKWLTGLYMDPGSIGNYGLFVGATASLGAANAAGRFDIKGTGTESGVFVGVQGGTASTASAIKVNNGGTDRFVVDTLGEITAAGGAWATYTPTLSTISGALSVATAVGRWKAIGKTVFVNVVITITGNGTGAGSVIFGLPSGKPASTYSTLPGRAVTVNGHALTGTVTPSATTCSVQKYDNTYPGVDGITLAISGIYETT